MRAIHVSPIFYRMGDPVSSSTDRSEGWPIACFKWLNPAALARRTIMTAPAVKYNTSILLC